MVKLQILEIKDFNEYVLYDSKNKTKTSLILEFYEMDKPNVKDFLFLHESLLNKNSENFAQPYAFKPIDNKNDNRFYEPDYAGLHTDEKDIILERIYG